jgi:hypothetical protein
LKEEGHRSPQRDGGIPESDSIERAEIVDDMEETSIPFYDAKPSRVVSGVGRFICTRRNFVIDNIN